MSLVSCVRLLVPLLVLGPLLAGAEKIRTAESAVTPVYASWHAKLHQKINADLAVMNGDVGLLLIGDSITAGWPTKGAKSYAAFAPWRPHNISISAEHTEHVLYRLGDGNIAGIKPKAAMILLGTNNLGHCPTEQPEWVAAGVQKIIDTLHATSPDTKVLLLALFPRGADRKGADGIFKNTVPTDSIRIRTVATNACLAKLADDKQVFFLDLGTRWVADDGSIRTDLMPDNLHPNEVGYQVWLDAVKPKLDELMR